MKENIFIPKQINVGFQNRNDTYTKKLAYIIYFDEKGTLRKEISWNSWRDKSIPNIIHDNVPTEGFVLNKKVGDYCSDWNHRQAYVRVYDPRDFEFEITIENLLYILENTSSIKGKGLEGEFIYGWDGKDLVLIPTCSPDYQNISKFNEILQSNEVIKGKDLVLGATYLTKQNEKWIYMGKYQYYDYSNIPKQGKYFWFAKKSKYESSDKGYSFEQIKTVTAGKLIKIIDSNCCDNYANIFDLMESNSSYCPYDETKDEFKHYTFEEFKNRQIEYTWSRNYYYNNNKDYRIEVKINDNKVIVKRKMIFSRQERYYGCYDYHEYKYWDKVGDTEEYNTLEEVFNKYKPQYINKYLMNGKFYSRGEA